MSLQLKSIITVIAFVTAIALPQAAFAQDGADAGKQSIIASSAKLEAAQPEHVTKQLATPVKLGVRYSVNVQGQGWTEESADNRIAGTTGQSLRIRNLRVSLDCKPGYGDVRYRVLLASGRWTAWKANGKAIGNHNDIEAVQVKLAGSVAKDYDVVYRAHVQNVAWQRRMRNGETAGVAGSGLRVEALRIELVSKQRRTGWIADEGTWSFYKKGVKLRSSWLDTSESPIDTSLAGKRRYWLDSEGALAVNRYVLPKREPTRRPATPHTPPTRATFTAGNANQTKASRSPTTRASCTRRPAGWSLPSTMAASNATA